MDLVIKALVGWSGFILDTRTRKLLSTVVEALMDLMLEVGEDHQRDNLLEGLLETINAIRRAKTAKQFRDTNLKITQENGKVTFVKANGLKIR